MLCIFDIFEGEVCGLVKNLVFMIYIIIEVGEEKVKKCVLILIEGIWFIEECSGIEMYEENVFIIYVNGMLYVLIFDVVVFIKRFKQFCCCGVLLVFIGIYISYVIVLIYIVIDEGCICWLYIIVENGKFMLEVVYLDFFWYKKVIFEDFLKKGVLEYLDVNEENDVLIVVYELDINDQIIYLEIELFIILGVVVGFILFFYYNQLFCNIY